MTLEISFADYLRTSGERYALAFAGQGAPWTGVLAEFADRAHDALWRQAEDVLAPVTREIVAAAPTAARVLRSVLLTGTVPAGADTADAAVSVPGIAWAQLLTLEEMTTGAWGFGEGPAATLGHSQGSLGAAIYHAHHHDAGLDIPHVLALSRLIGAAAARTTHRLGVRPGASGGAMAAVVGVDAGEAAQLADRFGLEIAGRNGLRSHALSGHPRDIARLADAVDGVQVLPVATPFHHSMMAPAVEDVVAWAARCGLPTQTAREIAEGILVDVFDWYRQVDDARADGVRWFLEIGPGESLTAMTAPQLEGTGAAIVSLGRASHRDRWSTPGVAWPEALDYTAFAPSLRELPDGRRVLDTRFTRLTGRSPVMLAAMTPTTVDPTIVAAAANAGFWAEMAGGGQYSAEVFGRHLDKLKAQLEPGRAVAFNSMFFDRYMWNLQIGVQKVVTRARAAGAPIDALTISAGIPDVDEATALLAELGQAGFTHVAFKPGTVDQVRQVLAIADANPQATLIIQVEDGHAGGHHSWEDLGSLLEATYGEIRRASNVVLCVGGGIGTPERAADYLTGRWSATRGLPVMPVDGVLVGTAAMACKEAITSPQVKQLLVDTPGLDPDAPHGGWVQRWQTAGGMTSGLSHLSADMYEVENASAACSRLIAQVAGDPEALVARRAEIIDALNKTAKPYFGDLEEMTYAAWAQRVLDLAFPWADETWSDRWWDLLRRLEARLSASDHGQIPTLFATHDDAATGADALATLLEHYPSAREIRVTPADAAWFVELCRKHHKPMPFVPVIDAELPRWWGMDTLWQSQDARYDADAVRVIPGPVSVAGITRVDEPVADLLGRFEAAAVDAVAATGVQAQPTLSRLAAPTASVEEVLRSAPTLDWLGHLIANPAHVLDPAACALVPAESDGVPCVDMIVDCDGKGSVRIPVTVPASVADGGAPVVDAQRLGTAVYELLALVAGIGTTSAAGDQIDALPVVDTAASDDAHPFGLVRGSFTLAATLGGDHSAVTGGALRTSTLGDRLPDAVLDALVGPCWPSIYAALGSAQRENYPVIEGLLNAVHLDHTVRLHVDPAELAALAAENARIDVRAWTSGLEESSAGRLVPVHLELRAGDRHVVTMRERFAIRARIGATTLPSPAPVAGGGVDVDPTPRSWLTQVTATAPSDMTAFALVSGDHNPIHVSTAAAQLSGLTAPLVHGMWLSAVAEHAVAAAVNPGVAPEQAPQIVGWTYAMSDMVALDDAVEITVERTGRAAGGHLVVEATCRVDGTVVSQGTALIAPVRTAYVYPGQGVQTVGMLADLRRTDPVVAEVFARADAHTCAALGFSVLTVIDENPTQLTARGVTYRHPAGVLFLTQFTQVALAVVAYAQTEQLRRAGMLVPDAMYAGHSLGEYTALSAVAGMFPLEGVIEIVFQRGSAMHGLVPRDAHGRSTYRLGALRPNQMGLGADDVAGYVDGIAESTGEFLQIVNHNVAGAQYAVAGTIAGLKALAADAERRAAAAGGKRPYVEVPGVDVPFHSRVLHPGVAAFGATLDQMLPERIDASMLVGRYVPNLVAAPFSLSRDYARLICQTVPAEDLRAVVEDDAAWASLAADEGLLARRLLIELLAWQFASPVRWIETQDLLLDSCAGRLIEVGLAASPTLTNLAERTLKLPHLREQRVLVQNLERDLDVVLAQDVVNAPMPEPLSVAEPVEATSGNPEDAALRQAQETVSEDQAAPVVATSSTPRQAEGAEADASPLPFTAADGLRALLAYGCKITLEQIAPVDTVETLTNGVSSRRNQLIMDLAAELGVASLDGAAEAPVATLEETAKAAVPGYATLGPVLSEALAARAHQLLGAARVPVARIAERVTGHWGLDADWAAHVRAEVLLGTREGESTRGGALTSLPLSVKGAADADALIDAAVQAVAARHGRALPTPGGAASHGGGVVDSAALEAFKAELLGADGLVVATARALLAKAGLAEVPDALVAWDGRDETAEQALATLDAELGRDWLRAVTPAFAAERAVLLDDRWATAREDLARVWSGQDEPDADPNLWGAGEAVAQQASWYAERAADAQPELVDYFRTVARQASAPATDGGDELAGKIAVVTGSAPGSIASAVVARLLAGGATVVMTASRVDDRRLDMAVELYRRHARPDAALWLVPANLSSYRDVDALAAWIGAEMTETVGATQVVTKAPMVPDLLFPFAAPPVFGHLAQAGAEAEKQARLLLWSVERMIGALSALGSATDVDHRLHVVLPGSPNRGTFGGDGAYGEVKAAFDAIVAKWSSEPVWSSRVTLAHPRIGWVQGTSLMGMHDGLVAAAQAEGVHVYDTAEMASELLTLCTPDALARAAEAPLEKDLTGGLGQMSVSLAELAASTAGSASLSKGAADTLDATIPALPTPVVPRQPRLPEWAQVSTPLAEQVVVVGIGELGTWGTARTRWQAETTASRIDDVDLTAAGVLELAWLTGLVTWAEDPTPGWYDADGTRVPEDEVYDRFRDRVVANAGVRRLVDDGTLEGLGSIDVATVYLDSEQTFAVASADAARAYVDADPEHTRVDCDPTTGEWTVTKLVGAPARVPRKATLSRTVGGQLPTGFDPARWGIPAALVQSLDRIALWNLVSVVEAFLAHGFTPTELLQAVHPADVASTQSTGIGGMESLRQVFLTRFLGEDRPSDILQEALPNVVAAHAMQSFVGGYGSMIHPIAACATAAVSIEEGADKIRLGKASFVVAGGIDDITVESLTGFGDMNATAESAALEARGISPRRFSRANDRRRGGFLEAQGGGTVLLARGDLAAELGLPVLAVVGYAASFADGAHTSIPAPGVGALAAGRGGAESALARALRGLGVGADDIAVVSKHDTSTKANDPNESELHTVLASALGRTPGNPLLVVSQKSLTGHAKGGAALFQVSGLCQIMATGLVPGNASLDCVDPELAAHAPMVWLRSPLQAGAVKAGLLTSLGFGHVAALVALVHPEAFVAALRESGGDVDAWQARAEARLAAGQRRREQAMTGGAPLFEPVGGRRLPSGAAAHDAEMAMLLDPGARLGADGVYPRG